MPNTPTPDLDRDALEAAQSYEVPAAIEAIAAALKARRKELIHQPLSFIYRQLAEAALAALPRAFGAEPVAEQLAGIARKLRTYVHIYTGDKEARQMAEWCESHASVAPMTVATRAIAERWRNDAFGAAAEIVESWFGADGHECAANIRALISSAPTPPSASSGDTKPLTFMYRNWRGEVSERYANPISVRWGSTEWHPEPQWLMLAFDIYKQAEREFAIADIEPSASSGDGELSRKKKRDGIKILSDEEEAAILSATSDMLGGSLAIMALENLHRAGFQIVRTAPSGEQG